MYVRKCNPGYVSTARTSSLQAPRVGREVHTYIQRRGPWRTSSNFSAAIVKRDIEEGRVTCRDSTTTYVTRLTRKRDYTYKYIYSSPSFSPLAFTLSVKLKETVVHKISTVTKQRDKCTDRYIHATKFARFFFPHYTTYLIMPTRLRSTCLCE